MEYKDLNPNDDVARSTSAIVQQNMEIISPDNDLDQNIVEEFTSLIQRICNFNSFPEDNSYLEVLTNDFDRFSQIIIEYQKQNPLIITLLSEIHPSMPKILFEIIFTIIFCCNSPSLLVNVLKFVEKMILIFPFAYVVDFFNEEIIFQLIQLLRNPDNLLPLNFRLDQNIHFSFEEASQARISIMNILTHYFDLRLSNFKNDNILELIEYHFEVLFASDDWFCTETSQEIRVQIPKFIAYLLLNLNCMQLNFDAIEFGDSFSGDFLKDELFGLYFDLLKCSIESPDKQISFFSLEALSHLSRFRLFHSLIGELFFPRLFDAFMSNQDVHMQKNILLLITSIAESQSVKAFRLFIEAINQFPDLIKMFIGNPEAEQRMVFYIMIKKVFENIFRSDSPQEVLNNGNDFLMYLHQTEVFAILSQRALDEESYQCKSEAASAVLLASSFLPDQLFYQFIIKHNVIQVLGQFVDSDSEVQKYVLSSLLSIINLINKLPEIDRIQLFQQLTEADIFKSVEEIASENQDKELAETAHEVLAKYNSLNDIFGT